MDFDVKKFKQMSGADLVKLVEHLSDEYRAVMTTDETFDAQTGAYAVLQKKGGGPETRKLVQMNSGFSSERRADVAEEIGETFEWAKDKGYEPKPHGELVEPGPFQKQSKKQKSAYTKASDGSHVPYDPKAKIGADGELAVLEHHAEMKIVRVAEARDYEVIALAPTRGCCPNCRHALQTVLGGEEKFKSVVPATRHTPQAYNEYLQKNLEPDVSRSRHNGDKASPPHAEPSHQRRPTLGGGEPKLPPGVAKFTSVVGKMAGHLGNAATAFDAFTTAADVSKDLRADRTEAAARKTLEFGGRTWGGIEGAAIGAELGAAAGSVVPGPGTLIGAAAGGVIGGIVGPTVGEDMARKLFDGLKELGKNSFGTGGKQSADHRSPEAPVLRRYLYDTTSAAVEKQVSALQHAPPSPSGDDIIGRLKPHAAEVLKPVSDAGEKLLRDQGYRSDAVVRALDDNGGGKHPSGTRQTRGVDTPVITTSVVGEILGGKSGEQLGLERDKRQASPLDRQRD